MSVVLRPTVSSDFTALGMPEPEFRVRAITGERSGEIVGIGGLARLANGTYAAFFYGPRARSVARKSLHKAGLLLMRQAKELGIKRVVAMADLEIAASCHWLERLGFRQEGDSEVWIWRTP